jgi:hypothetical protein
MQNLDFFVPMPIAGFEPLDSEPTNSGQPSPLQSYAKSKHSIVHRLI